MLDNEKAFKAATKRLKKELENLGFELSYGASLNLLSRTVSGNDYNTVVKEIKNDKMNIDSSTNDFGSIEIKEKLEERIKNLKFANKNSEQYALTYLKDIHESESEYKTQKLLTELTEDINIMHNIGKYPAYYAEKRIDYYIEHMKILRRNAAGLGNMIAISKYDISNEDEFLSLLKVLGLNYSNVDEIDYKKLYEVFKEHYSNIIFKRKSSFYHVNDLPVIKDIKLTEDYYKECTIYMTLGGIEYIDTSNMSKRDLKRNFLRVR